VYDCIILYYVILYYSIFNTTGMSHLKNVNSIFYMHQYKQSSR